VLIAQTLQYTTKGFKRIQLCSGGDAGHFKWNEGILELLKKRGEINR